MAAVATDTVTISINDVDLVVPRGELIVESVKRLGLEIPIFCYHPRMKPVGMCRMCIVEVGFKQPDGSVRKMPKPQAACTLPASDGMAIYTDSELVHRDRRGVLEFLLINHPLDCPICDRGGECPLQNNTIFYGPSTSRYVEIKRHLPKAFPLSQYVTLDLERCIQCGRCVRFTEEISGDSQLAFRFRGAEMQPSTFELRNFDSKFSGNVIEICPVGALTSSEYRFRARPWDLETRPAVCTVCSNGCSIWFDYRVGEMVRINGRTNEAVNEEWTCDRGKFGHEFYNAENRLRTPLIRQGAKLVACDWAEVYSPVLEAFTNMGECAALAGPMVANEGLYLLQKLFRTQFGSNHLDHRTAKTLPAWADRLENKLPAHGPDGSPMPFQPVQTPIADLESKKAIFVFGTSLADDLPIVYLRVRKAWFQNGAKVIVAHEAPTDADSFAHLLLRYRPGTGERVAQALLATCMKRGTIKVPDAMRKGLAEIDLAEVEKATGVAPAAIESAAALVGEGGCIVASEGIWNAEGAQGWVESLGGLAMCSGMEFNCYPLGANDRGADLLGMLPDSLPGGVRIEHGAGKNTHEILDACAAGQIQALWLVGFDPFALGLERSTVEKALESVEFLVVQDIRENEATPFASVVLPMAAPAEEDGTWTNCEGRVQKIDAILSPKGDAKPAWRIFSEFLLRAKPEKPYFSADEVAAEITAFVPQSGISAEF